MSEPEGPPLLWGPPMAGSSEPVLLPRELALQIRRENPELAKRMGITALALADGYLDPPGGAYTPSDKVRIDTVRADVPLADLPPGAAPTRAILGFEPSAGPPRPVRPRPTMGPADALALHAELRASLVREDMQKWVGAWIMGYERSTTWGEIPEHARTAGDIWCGLLRDALREANTYLVAAEANPLIMAAAETLPWSIAVTPQLPPSGEGFLAFAEPYEISDWHGESMLIRAVSWSRAASSMVMANMSQWPDGVTDALIVTFWIALEDHPGSTPEDRQMFADAHRRLGTRLSIAQSVPLPVGLPLEEWPLFIDVMAGGAPEGLTGPLSMIIATWMLMRRPVMSTTRGSMPPRVRKEIRKRGRIKGEISVINLRQRAPSGDRLPSEGEPIKREYHYRWTVKGHWRLGAVGPGRQDREWVYIFAHVKGPADKPLRQRPRVYRVSGRL